jgi:hypothetical protein
MITGAPSVTNCSSQASVTANQSYASGVVCMLLNGSVTNCMYLGSSVNGSPGSTKSCVVCINNGGTVTDCYFIAPTLSDANAKLMPHIAEDNTNFLTLLNARDEYLLKAGLTEEQINYDLTLNGREYKARKNDDGTWKRQAFAISLPFDMAIPEEQLEDVLLYKIHEIDTEKNEFIFTNEFPILKAGEPYIIVVCKGSLIFNGKNVLVKEVPMEPEIISNADGSQKLGYWCATFQKYDNQELVEQKAYTLQRKGTFRHIDKIYATNPYAAPFIGYFTAMEPIGTSFKMKYIRTENGEEIGEETDFPADLFYSDADINDDPVGISEIVNSTSSNSKWFDLQGRKLSGKPAAKGVYILGGQKMIFK